MPRSHQASDFRCCTRRQDGAALMIIMVIMVIGAAIILVNSLSFATLKNTRQEKTAAALAQAKGALIGFAITYGETYPGEVHGYLPCPDMSNGNTEGMAETANCGPKNISQIGRLPWKRLGLSPLRDGDGECLWYAVSGAYKNIPKTSLMNWDTNGQLQAFAHDGTLLTPPDNQIVAVIFAPGAVQTGQDRSGTTVPVCGGNYTVPNYLDSDTVHDINNTDIATGKFIQSHEDRNANGNIIPTVNDQMIFITKYDIFNALKRRNDFLATLNNMTQKVAECIADFGKKNKIGSVPDTTNKSLPWPAPLSLSDYGDNTYYNDKKNLYAGRVPYQVNTARLKTGNSIGNDYLLTKGTSDINGNFVNNCPNPNNWAAIYPWWDNWKDHLFYALSGEFGPQTSTTNPCSGGNCVAVNGIHYAAVIIFAGQKLSAPNQTRADKSVIADYLEGNNASNFAAANGSENYQTASASSTFNDVLYCIKEDLSVVPCP